MSLTSARRSLDQKKIDRLHGGNVYQRLVLALIKLVLVLFYECAHQLSCPISYCGQFRGRGLLNQGIGGCLSALGLINC